jgi:hypothetical protein
MYGDHELTVDVRRLARDVQRGRVPGMQILTPDEIQAGFRAEITSLAPSVDVEAGLAAARSDGAEGIAAYVKPRAEPQEGRQRGDPPDGAVQTPRATASG